MRADSEAAGTPEMCRVRVFFIMCYGLLGLVTSGIDSRLRMGRLLPLRLDPACCNFYSGVCHRTVTAVLDAHIHPTLIRLFLEQSALRQAKWRCS